MLVPVDESADGDIGPISGLTQRESNDFMGAIVTETGDEYAAKSVSVSWKGTPTDAQIEKALERGLLPFERIANVKALLDAQAAAHAAEVEALRESLDYANKGKAELEAEVAALRADDHPCPDRGQFTAVCRYKADRDAYRARIDKTRAMLDDWATDDSAAGWMKDRLYAALDGEA
jgi:hypothetical protein